MATLNQIDANRLHSHQLPGPATPEGKFASRKPLKSGITAHSQVIPGEDPADLESLTVEYYDQFHPATALERFLVDALVSADWQLRRLRRVEAELWAHQISTKERFGSLNEKAPLGNVFDYSRDAFTRLQRRIDAAERSYYRALNQLRKPIPSAAEPSPQGESPEAAAPEPDKFTPDPGPGLTPAAKLASFCTIPESPAARSFDSTSRSRSPSVNLRCSA